MTGNSYTTIQKYELEEQHMIAGDKRIFIYVVQSNSGAPIDLSGATCSVIITPLGDETYITEELSGTISGSSTFYTTFSATGLDGIYRQIVKIVDADSNIHKPAQGKIIVFPSPSD